MVSKRHYRRVNAIAKKLKQLKSEHAAAVKASMEALLDRKDQSKIDSRVSEITAEMKKLKAEQSSLNYQWWAKPALRRGDDPRIKQSIDIDSLPKDSNGIPAVF